MPVSVTQTTQNQGEGRYCTNLLYGSNYASLIFPDGSANRCYFQGPEGAIYETGYPRGSGWEVVQIVPEGVAKLHTPLSCISWPSNGRRNIRVYFISRTFELREICSDEGGAWYDGALTGQRVRAAPFSSVSAICFIRKDTGMNIRVYYQDTNFKLQEQTHENKFWHVGSTLPGNPLPGTCMSFVNRNPFEQEKPSIRGYYQETDGGLREVCWDNNWYTGDFHQLNAPYRVSLAATATPLNNFPKIHVYWLNGKNGIMEQTNDQGGWSSVRMVAERLIGLGGLSACSFTRSVDRVDVRLYLTTSLTVLDEVIYRQNVWEQASDNVNLANGKIYKTALVPM